MDGGPLEPLHKKDRQTDRHTDRQTHRQTDTQTDRHTDRQTDRQTDTHTHRQTDRHRLTEGQDRKDNVILHNESNLELDERIH